MSVEKLQPQRATRSLVGMLVVAVIAVAGVITVPQAQHPAQAATANSPWSVLLCKYKGVADEPHTVQWFENFVTSSGANQGGLYDYFRDASYGTVDLGGSVVKGWFQMPTLTTDEARDLDAASPSRRDEVIQACVNAAAAPGPNRYVVPSGHKAIVMMNACAVMGTVGQRTMLDACSFNVQGGAHEMSHVYGNDESWRIDWADPGAAPVPYGDSWDIMSAFSAGFIYMHPTFGRSGPSMNAAHRNKLGWLPDSRVFTFDPKIQTQATVQLAALDRPGSSARLMIRVPIDSDPLHYYSVEYRKKRGWDREIPQDTALVHEVRHEGNFGQRTYLLVDGFWGNPLQDFTDFAHNVAVDVQENPTGDVTTVTVRTVVKDGDFVRTPNGDLFRMAGGAPVWLSSYDPYYECNPNCAIFDVPDLAAFRQLPADGTILRAIETGHLYKVAGGAPLYITSCVKAPGVCVGNGITVNQATIDNQGDLGLNYHLRRLPADGTILDAKDFTDPNGGRLYKVAGGAALYLTNCASAREVCSGTGEATVNLATIDALGADPRPNAPKHLNQFPDDNALIKAAETKRIFKTAGGAPLLTTNCGAAGVCGGTLVWVNQGTIDLLGDPGSNKHLRPVPEDVAYIQASETGRVYVFAGGAPLSPPLDPCCLPPVVVNQGTVDSLNHMRDLPADGTVIVAMPSGRAWRMESVYPGGIAPAGWLPSWVRTPGAANAVHLDDFFIQTFSQTDPGGSLDVASVTGRTLRLLGWARDPNTVAPINVRIQVDGVYVNRGVVAAVNRPDLRNVFSAFGNQHGYDYSVSLTPGAHRVCVQAVNVKAGVNRDIACRSMTII